jgi:hypothetical protein
MSAGVHCRSLVFTAVRCPPAVSERRALPDIRWRSLAFVGVRCPPAVSERRALPDVRWRSLSFVGVHARSLPFVVPSSRSSSANPVCEPIS